MPKVFSNTIFIAAVAGLLSSLGLIYYVSKAVSPGIFGLFAITIIAVLFGLFVGLSSAGLSLLINLKKFMGGTGNCDNCTNNMPFNSNFCPNCGKRNVFFKIMKL
ncbi:MAG: hypothetical protein HYT71_02575 [Candidatus Aenigmarchaeota archaeon]|nr:hypothetical protein [Candidatus Aenigmarchaeota archaeon]